MPTRLSETPLWLDTVDIQLLLDERAPTAETKTIMSSRHDTRDKTSDALSSKSLQSILGEEAVELPSRSGQQSPADFAANSSAIPAADTRTRSACSPSGKDCGRPVVKASILEVVSYRFHIRMT